MEKSRIPTPKFPVRVEGDRANLRKVTDIDLNKWPLFKDENVRASYSLKKLKRLPQESLNR